MTINKLQRMLSATACVVSGMHNFHRGLSRLLHTDLRWVDVSERVLYKLCHGVQLPAWSSASVPRGIVPTSCRCRITATSPIHHPTAPSRTALLAQHLRPTGFFCGWSVCLEFTAREHAGSGHRRE